jgi:hypothetical protein
MEDDALKGFIFLIGLCTVYGFVLVGCMERRFKPIGRIIYEIEEDNKYVN